MGVSIRRDLERKKKMHFSYVFASSLPLYHDVQCTDSYEGITYHINVNKVGSIFIIALYSILGISVVLPLTTNIRQAIGRTMEKTGKEAVIYKKEKSGEGVEYRYGIYRGEGLAMWGEFAKRKRQGQYKEGQLDLSYSRQ